MQDSLEPLTSKYSKFCTEHNICMHPLDQKVEGVQRESVNIIFIPSHHVPR